MPPIASTLSWPPRALRKSLDECEFGDAILFADVPVSGPFRSVVIPSLESRAHYCEFILKRLASHISTPFALIVQWDGYVLSSAAWRSQFFDYDYIGAIWPWHTDGMAVGNGGFSLRSKKILALTADSSFTLLDGCNEDELICRVRRRDLERLHGIRIAPSAIANLFAYERRTPEAPTFGFHGLFNMWRHVDDAPMIGIINLLQIAALRSREFIERLTQ